MTRRHVAVFVKRTTYRSLVLERHDPLLRRLLARRDPTVKNLKSSSAAHDVTVAALLECLAHHGARVSILDARRPKLPRGVSLVISVGGDGTLLLASQLIGSEIPLLGVNSAPGHSVGFFCACDSRSLATVVRRALDDDLPGIELSRMRVALNGQALHHRVLNEALVCHASPAATSRYILRVESASGRYAEEDQRSSGIWVGPAAGSTAAQRSAGGRILPLSARELQFVVREPYAPLGERFRLAKGLIADGRALVLRSKMRHAKIFLDGHSAEWDVTLGDVVEMVRSDEPLTVLGLKRRRRANAAR